MLCAGLYPNIVRIVHPETTYYQVEQGALPMEAKANEIRLFGKAPGRVFIHPSSVTFAETKFNNPHAVYFEKVLTSRVYLQDVTMMPAYPILLFGGEVRVDHERGLVTVDDWFAYCSG